VVGGISHPKITHDTLFLFLSKILNQVTPVLRYVYKRWDPLQKKRDTRFLLEMLLTLSVLKIVTDWVNFSFKRQFLILYFNSFENSNSEFFLRTTSTIFLSIDNLS